MEHKTQVNSPTRGNLVSFQLSYTTADIERNVFHGAEATIPPQNIHAGGTVLVVHGEMYRLEEQADVPALPLTENAGIFGIIDLSERNR